jgi:hypothetical protein
MAGIGDFFEPGEIGEQLLVWSVLSQLVSAISMPVIQEIQQHTFPLLQSTLLQPNDAAAADAQGLRTHDAMVTEAHAQGVDTERYNTLLELAESTPDVGMLIAGLQRKLLDVGSGDPREVSFTGALSRTGVPPGWWKLYQDLAVDLPSPAEIIDAYVKSQIDEGAALLRFTQSGGEPDWFQTAYNAAGEPPAPGQLAEMVHRGFIPWTGTGPDVKSFEQGLREGHTKDKWITELQAISEYLPPPRTITAMFHGGQLAHDQAAKYLAAYGLDTDLIAAYLTASHSSATVTDKHLAKGDIVTLYTDHLLSKDAAITALVALKYSAADATLLLQVSDLRAAAKALTAGTAQVKELLIHGHIGQAAALASLEKLAIPGIQAQAMIDTWTTTKAPVLKTLTAAQIERAAVLGLISNEQAYEALQSDGYSAIDAWLALSIAHKEAITDVPRPAGSV